MTIIESYKNGCDLKGVLQWLGLEKLVYHVVLMFLKDDGYLVEAFEKKDAEEAFLAAHIEESLHQSWF